MTARRWEPTTWVTVESAGRSVRFRRGARNWFVESVRFGGSELMAEDAPLSQANPALAEHLEALASGLMKEE